MKYWVPEYFPLFVPRSVLALKYIYNSTRFLQLYLDVLFYDHGYRRCIMDSIHLLENTFTHVNFEMLSVHNSIRIIGS